MIIKLLKEQNYEVIPVFFRLPFASDKEINDDFLSNENLELKIFDCTKGKLLIEYLDILTNPQYGYGAGMNPCIDCKIFMFNHVKQYAIDNSIEAIASGEVPGQRPMSQTASAEKIIDNSTDFNILRPLKVMGITGRSRNQQMQLAEKYKINYPTPAGGCLLCEKGLAKRFKTLLYIDLINDKTLYLAKIGRHYYFSEKELWIIVGRNAAECEILEKFPNVIKSGKGKPAVYYQSKIISQEIISIAAELQKFYQSKNKEQIESFKLWKL